MVETIGNEWNVKMLNIMKDKPVTRDFDKEIAEINKQLIELMGYPQEQCPQCGHKFAPKTVDSTSKRLESVLADTSTARIDYNKGLEEYEIKVKALGERPTVDNSKIRALEVDIYNKEQKLVNINNIINTRDLRKATFQEKITDKEAEKVEKEGKITVLIAEIQALMVEIMGSDDIKKQEVELNGEKFKIEMELRLVVEGLSLARNAGIMVVSNEGKLKRIKDTIEELDIKIEALMLLKEALGVNGIKAMVIDYIVVELETKINEILNKLSNFRVRIDTQRSSADGEKQIEGLYITTINDQGEELDFNSFSGGERVKIKASIREGLASLQKFAFKILDEEVVGLDAETIEVFASVMLTLKESTSQLLVISHIDEIKNLFEEQIEVVKVNGESKIITN